MKSWSSGSFAAVALICLAAQALYIWRGGASAAFISCGTAILLANALLTAIFGMRGAAAARTIPQARCFAGQDVYVTVTVRRRAPLPTGWFVMTDIWSDGQKEQAFSKLMFAGFHRSFEIRYKLSRLARGRYRFLRTELYGGDWFGLLRRKLVVSSAEEIAVYPRPLALAAWPIGAPDEYGARLLPHRNTFRTSPVVSGVRQYETGDPFQRIHWKASARTGALKTKVTELGESERITVILDSCSQAYAGGAEGAASFETAVRAAAAMMEWAVRRRWEAGLHISGNERLALPMERRSDMTDIYEALSRARPDGKSPAADALLFEAAGLSAEGTIVCITALPDERLLRAARILRAGRNKLVVWIVYGTSAMSTAPGSAAYNRIKQELETAGCMVAGIYAERPQHAESGGAEDVTA